MSSQPQYGYTNMGPFSSKPGRLGEKSAHSSDTKAEKVPKSNFKRQTLKKREATS